jgi:(5-formylfuran-3-yl)methyl phosphate synthase
MKQFVFSHNRSGLLVSVRSADEALTALAGGADVIDVKEPNRGSLGAADMSTIREVVRAVDGRAPVTAALGELSDVVATRNGNGSFAVPDGVSLFKTGLSHCAASIDWRTAWKGVIGVPLNRRRQPIFWRPR